MSMDCSPRPTNWKNIVWVVERGKHKNSKTMTSLKQEMALFYFVFRVYFRKGDKKMIVLVHLDAKRQIHVINLEEVIMTLVTLTEVFKSRDYGYVFKEAYVTDAEIANLIPEWKSNILDPMLRSRKATFAKIFVKEYFRSTLFKQCIM